MLPSTGYFKGINCPFYDNGLCERPYCHFRHVKKESQNIANDGIESGAILQKLVSAAVQKVLQQTEASGTQSSTQYTTVNSNIEGVNTNNVPVSKATYNPTPIAELNKINSTDTDNNEEVNEQRKRHIPVPYTPRKPASLPLKRPVDTNGSSKPFIYIPPPVKYTPGCTETVQIDQYTPKGSVESKEKYLPGTEIQLQEYTPNDTQQTSSKRNYVPSDKNVTKKKILEYKPEKVTAKTEAPSVTYQPTPRSLAPCFSSDEEEPDNKKRKLSTDLNGLDELGAEFDILDQILDEENSESDNKHKSRKEEKDKSKDRDSRSKDSKDCKENKSNHNHNKKEKEVIKSEHKSSHDKQKSDKKDKSSHKEKDEKKSKSSEKKSSHKSSSRDKERSRDEKKDKHSTDKKRHSSSNSKSSDRSSKSKHSSSSGKDSDRYSKHSDSSKRDSKKHDTNNHKTHKSSRDSKEKEKHKSKRKEITKDLSDNDSNHYEDGGGSDINEEESIDISEDEDTIALECKRIFEEYVPTEKPQVLEESVNKHDEAPEEEYIPAKKRISRTANKEVKVVGRASLKPDYKMSAAQTMANRLAKVREYHAAKASADASNSEASLKLDASKTTFNTPGTGSKIRIAHVPYVSSMINAKKTISPVVKTTKSEPSTSSTTIQTVQKGAQRVAHVPNDKLIDRPGVLEPLASKIAANVRSTYLNMMIDECLKIYLLPVDAYARAQHEELNTSKKCSTVQIYKNSAAMTVNRLRKELQEANGVKKSGSDCTALRNLPQGSAKTGPAGSWSIVTKNRKSFDESKEFSGSKFYNNIKKWILTEEQLKENGFPRPHPTRDKGRAIIYGQNKKPPPKGFIRTCCRCKQDYTVDKKGFAAVKQECIYHPNNKYRIRGEVRYQCCSQDGTSDGCCVAPSHVYEYVDYENLKGYIKTLPPETVMDDYGVYSLDCEMCYTTHGLDLTRVTVINSSCKVVYETLIKPLHPIIDYNTRYSGITEEQMANVRTTLLEVQATLLTMFNSKTILIGHSLESDFKALKLIHDTVIDTSVLFPHKMGPPYKRALRNLSSEHLKKIIQNSVEGHDSAEDAMVCMELLHYKLKEDLKTR